MDQLSPILLRAGQPTGRHGSLEVMPDVRITPAVMESLVNWLDHFAYLTTGVQLTRHGSTVNWHVQASQPSERLTDLHAAVWAGIQEFLTTQIGGSPDAIVVLIPAGHLGVPMTSYRGQLICKLRLSSAYTTPKALADLREKLVASQIVRGVRAGPGFFICELLDGHGQPNHFVRIERGVADCLGDLFPGVTFYAVPVPG